MTSTEQALERIANLDADQVRQLVVRRILGEDTVALGSRFIDEASEDLVIHLLRKEDLPKEIRAAVISGCKQIYSQLLAWLAAPHQTDGTDDLQEVATRLCRVVDVTGPSELSNHADAMLNLALGGSDLPSGFLSAAVRASMAFGRTPEHVPLWESVLRRPEVAAYAFNALLEIDPYSNRIDKALETLRQRQLHDGWNVDAEFLTQRANRIRSSISSDAGQAASPAG